MPENPLNPLMPLATAKIIGKALAKPVVPVPAEDTNETGIVKYPLAFVGVAVIFHV